MKIEQLYKLFLESNNVSTDTRTIHENDMYFALKGDNFNGNKFCDKAFKNGASYCIIDEETYATNTQCIVVDNVLKTLQELATFHRNTLKTPIVALTGSNGKTTTKELITAVLSQKLKTSATIGNLNNHIGVPLTLLKMTSKTEIGIVEMGANHPKEIAFLCNIALPDYGLITNFGKAHLEGFGSLEGVIKAKSELYDYLKANNKTIFVNKDDAVQLKQTKVYSQVITFGSDTITFINSQPYVSVSYNNETINSQLTGSYNYSNIASAIAVGNYFKIQTTDIKNAIENYIPSNNRSQIITKGTNKIILDAYNANPTSMQAALENFEQAHSSNKILFLGDMFELGETADIEHQHIVSYLETHPFSETFLIGNNFYKTTFESLNIKKFKTFEDLKTYLKTCSFKDAFILIKGSRGMALERIVDIL